MMTEEMYQNLVMLAVLLMLASASVLAFIMAL